MVEWRSLFLFCSVWCLGPGTSGQTHPDTEWWKTAVLYQIYPRSFYDTDGNGVGDIRGVTAKLPYLKDTGIDATWLSPIFKSPQRDFGYDVSDFLEVDPLFGTNDDLEELFAEARKLGLKIVLDFVPNHTSNEHLWFKQSELGVEPYRDYYVWHPGRPGGQTRPDVPNNWNSVFYGSAWEWSEIRQEYYLHQFEVGQPDLNYRNGKVIEEFDSILRFWMERGASGFRVDAVNHMFEDALLRDEPINDPSDPLSYGYTHHIYTNNLLETYDVIGHWRKVIDDFVEQTGSDTMYECCTKRILSMDMLHRFYQSDDGSEQRAHFPFNFVLLGELNGASSARDFKYVIDRWLENLPRGKVTNWVLGNHDQPRVASRYGPERVDAMNMLLMTLPGVAVTYNGEEIGMVDYRDMSWEDSLDPQGCNVGPDEYRWKSRDPQRTPFQWDDTFNAGFSTANKTWLPVYPYYRATNLRKQMESERSHYRVYTEAVKLRRHRVFREGLFRSKALTEHVFSFVRYLKADQGDRSFFIVIINLSDEVGVVDLHDLYDLSDALEVRVYLVGTESRYKINQLIDSSRLLIAPYESIIVGNDVTSSQATLSMSLSAFTTCIVMLGASLKKIMHY